MTKQKLIKKLKKYRDIELDSVKDPISYQQGFDSCIECLVNLLKIYETELITMIPVEFSEAENAYQDWYSINGCMFKKME